MKSNHNRYHLAQAHPCPAWPDTAHLWELRLLPLALKPLTKIIHFTKNLCQIQVRYYGFHS
jgi:hypothetical protein